MSRLQFQTGDIAHVFGRGVDKREIFKDKADFIRFSNDLKEFNSTLGDTQRKYLKTKNSKSDFDKFKIEPLVGIISYCLAVNHYHLILKQRIDNGISDFMRKLGTGYTKYFNKRYDRTGHLFQGAFKSVPVTSDEQLLYLSGYVNGNIEIHKVAKAAEWPWSSHQELIGKRNGGFCDKKVIMDQFKSVADYQEFIDGIIIEAGKRKDEIKCYELG